MDALAVRLRRRRGVGLVLWRRWPLPMVGVVAATTVRLPPPATTRAARRCCPDRWRWPPVGYAHPPGRRGSARPASSPWPCSSGAGSASATSDVMADPRRLGASPPSSPARLVADPQRTDRRRAGARPTARASKRSPTSGCASPSDLHDSVAHAMATINVQSGVAAHLLDRRPEQAKRGARGDPLGEQRRPRRARRDPRRARARAATDSTAPRSPVAGLDQLDELVARARVDGLAVDVRRARRRRRPSVPSVSTAAYRVVQEALTQHRAATPATAPPPPSRSTVDGGGTGSVVEVIDDGGRRPSGGRAAAGRDHGFGLVGMRERVESTGGVAVEGRAPVRGSGSAPSWDREPDRT